MINNIIMLTFKPIIFLGSTGYLMFAQLPAEIPLNADKSIALGIAIWALIATKRELIKTREDFKAELKEERARSDDRLDSLNKVVEGIHEISKVVKGCPGNDETRYNRIRRPRNMEDN
jgi:hypothetical protein